MEADKDKQAPMFTVQNAEGAMVAIAIFAIASLVTVCLHEILLKNKGFFRGTLYNCRQFSENYVSSDNVDLYRGGTRRYVPTFKRLS